MSNEDSLPRLNVSDYPSDESESPEEFERPQWFMGDSREAEGILPEVGDEEPDNAEERAHPELFRAGKIDAYLRYTRMRPPPPDDEPVTLRRAMPARQQPSYGNYRDSDEEYFTGYQSRAIRRAPQRSQRPMRRPQRHLVRDIAIAATLSIAIGSLTALIVYDRTSGGVIAQALVSQSSTLWDDQSAPAGASEATTTLSDPIEEQLDSATLGISKKTVAIALLDVEDASGNASSPIPLSMRADPAIPGQDLALRLSGLPDDAYLTAGTKLSNNGWILQPGEELGVKLMVPASQTGQYAIAVEAIESRTGDLAAPIKEMTIQVRPAFATQIEPAGAVASISRNFNLPQAKAPEVKLQPDAAMPIPAPIEKTSVIQSEAAQGLVRSGDKLMGLGDLTAARQFYEKALEEGVSEAALKLGQTFDPAVFAEKNVQGLKPDPAMAMKYYLQAQASGIADASQSINGLQSWMQR